MPDPVLRALIHVLVLEEEWASTSKKRHESPEEEKGEHIERPKANKATENDHKLVAWQISIIHLHLNQKLIAG